MSSPGISHRGVYPEGIVDGGPGLAPLAATWENLSACRARV